MHSGSAWRRLSGTSTSKYPPGMALPFFLCSLILLTLFDPVAESLGALGYGAAIGSLGPLLISDHDEVARISAAEAWQCSMTAVFYRSPSGLSLTLVRPCEPTLCVS